MVAKTKISRNDFLAILSLYELGEFQDAQPFESGTVQTNYLLITTQGKFVLKFYENRSHESVRFEANGVNYICQRDFPCPMIHKNRKGQSVGVYQEKSYIIFAFAEGQPIETLTPYQQQQVIHAAATLQTITKGYRPHLRQFRWNYNPKLCLQLAQERAENIGTNNAHAKLKWFKKTLAELKLPKSLPKGICHCDYDWSNIFFIDGEFAALIDFDDANYTYLFYDLGNFLNGWAWEYGEDFDPKAAREIVDAYRQTRELSSLEKRHLFDVHKLNILMDGIWFFARGHVDDFYERQKIEYLDGVGRETYYDWLFA